MNRKILYGFIGGAMLSAIGTLLGVLLGIKLADKQSKEIDS